MASANHESSISRQTLAGIPPEPSRGNCSHGLLHRTDAHVRRPVLLLRDRPRPENNPAFQRDPKSECSLDRAAAARSVAVRAGAQIPFVRLHALIERIDLDGRRSNAAGEREEPFRYEGNGGIAGFIKVAAKWIAASCKERELWWNFRNTQMQQTDQNAVSTKAERYEQRDLDKLYFGKSDVETAEMDRAFADELDAGMFGEGNAYDDAVNEGPDKRMVGGSTVEQWEYVRSVGPLPFYKEDLRYTGRKLVNVPWWER
jgi:hypothetical protein